MQLSFKNIRYRNMDLNGFILSLLSLIVIQCTVAIIDIEEPSEKGMKHLLQQKCGDFLSSNILRGNEVRLTDRPWMAILKFRNESGMSAFKCTGTLISERFVLTAANCFLGTKPVSVRLAEHQLGTDIDCRYVRARQVCTKFEEFKIEETFIHEDFQSETENDIALVKLSQDVEFSRSIKPICLPLNRTLQENPEEGKYFFVTGWSFLEKPKSEGFLRETTFAGVNRDNCVESFLMELNETQLCANSTSIEACNGDTGGPLSRVALYKGTQHMVQFGIISLGLRDCLHGHPTVFTNVGRYIPWITNIIGKHK